LEAGSDISSGNDAPKRGSLQAKPATARTADEITPGKPIKFNPRERPFPQFGRGRFLFLAWTAFVLPLNVKFVLK
jgi:hypothetical protein